MAMPNIKYKYYRFGSKDSLDIDILIEHPNSLGNEGDSNLIAEIWNEYPETANWNINIIKIKSGVIANSIPSKGSPDSVNNSLYETYHLHEQIHLFPLDQKVERILILAIVKCIRAILTSLKRNSYHEIYKRDISPLLKSNLPFSEWIKCVELIDFNQNFYDNKVENSNKIKSLAFHVGQTISLIQGIGIYNKQELCYYHPELTWLIKREHGEFYKPLKEKIKSLCSEISSLKINESSPGIVELNGFNVNYKTETLV